MKKNGRTATSLLAPRAARKVNVSSWRQENLDILIRTDGVDLTDKLRAAIGRKIGRARRYATRAFRARVQLHRVRATPSPEQFRARVHYEIPGNDLVAEHTAHDPAAALDIVAEKMEGQLRRRKTARLVRRVRRHRADAHRWHPAARG
ncbi:MAG TPA: ribosome-associated translation inhibitor RaiA [Candidatus Paceibacterota bacterium]|nr:ribosome-associated translation inhibitor RaiA [Verrucomicrobiota bacterium]HSA09808.1 ribosome-associated translation inhibitor RaiA [Candidatus Paceibacterota bacterium]